LEENYEFDWENIAILDEEPQYRKSIRDATHQKIHGLNLQTNLEGLSKAYFPIVDGL